MNWFKRFTTWELNVTMYGMRCHRTSAPPRSALSTAFDRFLSQVSVAF
jgi:hypothetical protein